jgi:hypothetical protein
MATINMSKRYVLANAYTQAQRYLAISTDFTTVIMQAVTTTSQLSSAASDSEIPKNQQWFFTETSIPPFYRLHTVSGGTNRALDIRRDTDTDSIHLRMVDTGTATGQYWRLDAWDGGSDFRLSNNYTGLEMHLDVYSDTLEPHLAKGDLSGQHWSLTALNSGTSTSTSSAFPSGSTTSATESSEPVVTHGATLSTAAIAGITGAGVAVLILVGLAIFIFLRRARRRERLRSGAMFSEDVGRRITDNAMMEEMESKVSLAELVSPRVHCRTTPNHHTELEGADYQAFLAELPTNTLSELPDNAAKAYRPV